MLDFYTFQASLRQILEQSFPRPYQAQTDIQIIPTLSLDYKKAETEKSVLEEIVDLRSQSDVTPL